MTDGQTVYRFTGILGTVSLILWPMPAALIILLSAALHWREAVAPEYRRMARAGLIATVLIVTGLLADLYGWAWAMFEIDAWWLVALWRLALNVGIALALSVVLYAIYIAKRGLLPTGIKALWVPAHLVALALVGCMTFLCLVALGVAGTL